MTTSTKLSATTLPQVSLGLKHEQEGINRNVNSKSRICSDGLYEETSEAAVRN